MKPEKILTGYIRDFSVVEDIYHKYVVEDFPRNELKPLNVIKESWKNQQYCCFASYIADELMGYAFFVKHFMDNRCYYLLDYLAVIPKYRNQGCGAVFLKQLINMITDVECIVAEVEDPDQADDSNSKQRRLDFYLQNGYIDNGVKVRLFGVDYRILEIPCGKSHSTEEICKIYEDIYKSILPESMHQLFLQWT